MNHSEPFDEVLAALAEFQKAMPMVERKAKNPFFNSKYADMPTVVTTAKVHLEGNGLTVTQMPGFDPQTGADTLETVLFHKSGQWIGSTMRLHLTKLSPQDQGAAITYARRYAYSAVLGIVADEDTDGNASRRGKSRGAGAEEGPDGESEPRNAAGRRSDSGGQSGPSGREPLLASKAQINLIKGLCHQAEVCLGDPDANGERHTDEAQLVAFINETEGVSRPSHLLASVISTDMSKAIDRLKVLVKDSKQRVNGADALAAARGGDDGS